MPKWSPGYGVRGERLRALRLKAGLRQGDLAKRAGVATTTVVSSEKMHETPRLATIYSLAKALNVEPNSLLRFDPELEEQLRDEGEKAG